MKNKALHVILAFFTCITNQLTAADFVVQQGGPAGTYSSISAAITASSNGDNIVINNRTDGLPWLENLTINKSLTFVSAIDNIQWWMEGTINIVMGEGRVITLLGLRNTSASGEITRSGTTPVSRTILNILFSDLASNITMGSGVSLYLGSSKAMDVNYTYGQIYGNDLRSLGLTNDGVSNNDLLQIIGNRIGLHTTPSFNAATINTNTQYVFISNNYFRSSIDNGLVVNALRAGATINRIVNCAIVTASTDLGDAGLQLSYSSGSLSVENCALAGRFFNSSFNSNGVRATGFPVGNAVFTYNMFQNYNTNGLTLSTSLNNFTFGIDFSSFNSDGSLIGTAHVDTGNPANTALDLDLTRNDIGVFGGSYSMSNFLPLVFNVESSRVNFVNTPRIVNQGTTFNVQAIGYDK